LAAEVDVSEAAIAGLRDAQAGADHGSARFAGYIAHELRTPLATQRALLELALADPDADTAAWRDVGEDVLGACRQQERLLDACLALSRSRGGLSRCETVDLGSVVAGLVRTRDLRGLSARSSLERALTIGDPDLIERLVDNLLGNAVGHNRVGGWIEVTTRRSGTKALFTVENTGPPIPARELTRPFEPFQQLAAWNTRAAGGLGLGLAVVTAVVDAHDALVTARARPGGGLRVEVAFAAANR
jgi:signal transduction histidine kinase